MGNKSEDLVCVFDIESGIWAGSEEGIEVPDSRLEDALMRILRMYDQDTVVRESKKITVPRYVSVAFMPWETFRRGCYEDPELAFLYDLSKDQYTFLLTEDGIDQFLDFWTDLLTHIRDRGNVLLLAHNANYDINGILNACRTPDNNSLIRIARDFLEASRGDYKAFPETLHDDKTFDLRMNGNHLRLVDTINLSSGNCRSLKQYGIRASAMFGKDYNKGDQYDYDYKIRSAADIPPSEAETVYTTRDLQLCLFAAMLSIYSYRKPLEGRGQYYGPSDFPFSATIRDKAVNDGLTVLRNYPDSTRTEKKRAFRQISRSLKKWCATYGNVPDLETYELLHKASGGGIITCNEAYVNKIVEGPGSMDLSSSYPANAGDFWYPRIELKGPYTGPMDEEIFREYLKTVIIPMAEELRSGSMVIDSMGINHKYSIAMKIGFTVKVRFHDILYHDFGTDSNGLHYWLPILPYKDYGEGQNREQLITMRGKVIDNETLEYYTTHVGLIIILAFYDYSSIDFLGGYTYEMAPINRAIHDRFRSGLIGKQKAKKIKKQWEKGEMPDEEMIRETGLSYLSGQDHDTIRDELQAYYDSSKVPLNAMYGANYRKLLRDRRVILDNGDYDTEPDTYSPDSSVAYPTGLYIAVYGQLKIAHAMLWAMSKRLPLLYVHTDSLKIQGLTPELVTEYNELIREPPDRRDGEPISFRSTFGIGQMDYEGSHDLGIVIGNMRIVTWDRDSGYHITMSGLNESKAFPKKKIKDLDFFEFCTKYLRDGKKYSLDSDTQSGKTLTDYSLAGLHIPGIGYTMQSIVDAEFILNNPESVRQKSIVEMYNEVVGDYHTAAWYAKRKYVIKLGGQNNAEQKNHPGEQDQGDHRSTEG